MCWRQLNDWSIEDFASQGPPDHHEGEKVDDAAVTQWILWIAEVFLEVGIGDSLGDPKEAEILKLPVSKVSDEACEVD